MEVVDMRRLTIIMICLIIATAVIAGASQRRPDHSSKESKSETTSTVTAPSSARVSGPSYSAPRNTATGGSSSPARYTPSPAATPQPDRSTYTRVESRPSVTAAPRPAPVRTEPAARPDSHRPIGSSYQRPSSPTPDTSRQAPAATLTDSTTRPSGRTSHYSSGGSRDSGYRDHGPSNIPGAAKTSEAVLYPGVDTQKKPEITRPRPTSPADRSTQKPEVTRPRPTSPVDRSTRGSEKITAEPATSSSRVARPETTNRAPAMTDNRPIRSGTKDDKSIYRPDGSRTSAQRDSGNSVNSPSKSAANNLSQATTRTSSARLSTRVLGYRPALPRTTKYVVGYRPAVTYVPPTYRPPVYRTGFYYYPATYYDRPCYFAYWAPIYAPGFSYRSVYFSFGLFPYVTVTRISSLSYTRVNYVSTPIYIDGTYYHNSRYDRVDDTLSDIRSAWISGRYDLIERHVRADRSIAVLLDGQYDYSIVGDDYLAMTRDALGDLETTGFVWNKVRERADGTLTAFGEHSFWSADNVRTVYVSYTFQKVGSSYYITEVGSSDYRLD